MMSLWIKALMATNVFLYRLTRGALGSRMGGQNVLLLNTIGRKTGKAYTTPTNYFRDGGNYVLVASNWGRDRHPAWYINLMQQKTTTVQVKGDILQVSARQASSEEYQRLWQFVTSQNPYYLRYQSQTKRHIPVVVLAPEKR